ncbi:MAG: hypothetical protein H0V66_00155 [Bdellovibrionales bacterium]|nr:hypothetical protein [Bdellovibrionales bacterium]
MKNLQLVLLLLSLMACSIFQVVNVADHNKKTQEILGQAERGVKRVEMDVLEHEQILAKWKDSKSVQSLNRMRSMQQNLLQNYIRMKEDFANTPFHGKTKLTSKDKEFNAFNAHQKDFKNRFDILDKQFDNYRDESNKLNAYLETKSILKVNSQKVKEDFVNTINEAKRAQLKVKNELMDYNVKLNQSTLKPEVKSKQKTILQDLVKMVEKIENETFKLQRLFNATMTDINSGVKYVTPGMKAHNYLGKIQNHVKAIQVQIDEFNSKSKTLID